ncbi:uncharacterized protein LOC112510815 [Cynara cardunculus var. scolymus]|uniref:uncharacterized protein LOC112510815 n=1 Tax=Cynara cardunculus var. scolymus TaxID=59895 RepID=UPI000D630BC4|nr:uncharacterized protein LOC112510815 [Cynara cardunculus var. scolymus]
MKEHVKVVTLRSGKELIESEPLKKIVESSKSPTENDVTTPTLDVVTPILKNKGKSIDIGILPKKVDFPLIFPNEGKKVSFQDETSTSFTNTDNPDTSLVTPIVKPTNHKAIEQMPSYAKFLKDILSKKKKLSEYEIVALTEGCSALLSNKLPHKLKDPGSFTIPYLIGGKEIGKALCDLGASINLMPLSVFNTLGIGEARPTTIILQLADKSIAHPKGKIEDVLVQVHKFIFPADFIILDFEADKDISIILGRPFLATERTLIDVQKGELTMRVNE